MIITPPQSVFGVGVSLKNIHTQIGAKTVSIMVKSVTSEEGSIFVPIPIKTLEIGVKIAPMKKITPNEYASGKTIVEVINAKNAAISPPPPIHARRLTSLYRSNTEKSEENEMTHKNA